MAGVKGTRIDYGQSIGSSKDQKSGDLKQSSSVTAATNAKVPVDGVDNQAREKNSPAMPTTRKTAV